MWSFSKEERFNIKAIYIYFQFVPTYFLVCLFLHTPNCMAQAHYWHVVGLKNIWRINYHQVFRMEILQLMKVLFLCVCLGISSLQSYYEIENYLENKIFTSSDIINVDSAPIHLVFCDTYPLENRVDIVIRGIIELKGHIIARL